MSYYDPRYDTFFEGEEEGLDHRELRREILGERVVATKPLLPLSPAWELVRLHRFVVELRDNHARLSRDEAEYLERLGDGSPGVGIGDPRVHLPRRAAERAAHIADVERRIAELEGGSSVDPTK
jgi:hypothetical protein